MSSIEYTVRLVLTSLSSFLQQRCLPINPYDKLQCARAINEALVMPEQEKISRWRDLERHVWSQTAQHWCTGFLHALQREVVDVKTKPQSASSQGGSHDGLPPVFKASAASAPFDASAKRLLLLDFEGTLCHDDLHASGQQGSALLDEETTAVLSELAGNAKNTVYIMSGRSVGDLQDLARSLPKIGFV